MKRYWHGQGRKYNGLIWERFENLFIQRIPPLTDLVASRLRDTCARRLFLFITISLVLLDLFISFNVHTMSKHTLHCGTRKNGAFQEAYG